MKDQIIDKVIAQEEDNLKDLTQMHDMKMNGADLDEEDTRDADDFSQQDQNMDLVSFYEEQMNKTQSQIASLKQYKELSNDAVSNGALVETNDGYYLFGASFKNTAHEGKPVIGISQGSPAFTNNLGKKVNQYIQLGNQEKQIQSIQ